MKMKNVDDDDLLIEIINKIENFMTSFSFLLFTIRQKRKDFISTNKVVD